MKTRPAVKLAAVLALLLVHGAGAAALPLDSSRVEPRSVPTAELARLQADPAFDYSGEHAPAPSLLDRIARWSIDTFFGPMMRHTPQPVLRYGPYVLMAIVLALAIMQILGGWRGGLFARAEERADSLEARIAQEGIAAVELDRLAEQAARERNYRLAVRLDYLRALQTLARAERISWTPDKTNRAYLRELAGSPAHPPFADLTRVFEAAWYGEARVDEATFRSARARLEDLGTLLQPARAT